MTLNLNDVQSRWKRLLQFICLVRVFHAQGVQISGAADLELGDITSLLNLHRSSVLTTSSQEKLLDFLDSLWLQRHTMT